jgi:prefoldin subunit 5
MKKYEEEKQKVEVLNNQLNEYEKQILYLKDHIKRIDQTKVTMDNKMQLDYVSIIIRNVSRKMQTKKVLLPTMPKMKMLNTNKDWQH